LRIFLTGANGFTGKYFSELARLEGHQIIQLEGDITDRSNVTSQIHSARADFVIHLAAISFVAHENISQIYAVNVVGTENVLEATYTAP
jgi:nucleoside-diphosphate-sugar epimerase